MTRGKHEDRMAYKVVINHEGQYSIWSDFRDIPDGWRTVGKTGDKETCLTYIKEVWTDMRPLSLRGRIDTDRSRKRQIENPASNNEGAGAHAGAYL
jgi:MbtH protein